MGSGEINPSSFDLEPGYLGIPGLSIISLLVLLFWGPEKRDVRRAVSKCLWTICTHVPYSLLGSVTQEILVIREFVMALLHTCSY